jgi:hypothetical protein
MNIIDKLADLFTGVARTTVDMFQHMDTNTLAVVGICALVVAAMCLRGNPVRGA